MSDLAIQVQGLGKRYALGGRRKPYKTIRESFAEAVTAPFRRATAPAGADGATSFWALRDVDFTVNRGEVVGIIGRNGAGKSTLLKVLSRITDPTEGQIQIDGRVGSLLEVGTGFHPELTGRENVYLNGAILGMRRAEITRKFDEIVAFAETERFLDTPVKFYSSGMYTRLAFAVAAHLDPEILIVDEVLAVGDAEFQKKCLGKMKDVAGEGRTVLFVSHNMNAVEHLCRSVLLLRQGRVAARSHAVRSVIADYMFPDAGNEASWTNPEPMAGNPYFWPTRFYLGGADGAPLPATKSSATDAWIYIEAEVRTLDPALTVGYAIYAEDGACLYWSYQTDADPDLWPALRRGRQRLRGRLPTRLFNEGTYRVELIGGLTHRQWLFQAGTNAPAIFFTVRGGLSDSPLYTTARPTILAPIIEWTVDDA